MAGLTTVTFARHDGVDIKLGYKLPAPSTSNGKAPILLWFHGGGEAQPTRVGEFQLTAGLLQGTRTCTLKSVLGADAKAPGLIS